MPVSDKYTLILLVLSVGLIPSPLMSMFTDMANVSASGRINKHSFLLAAAGCSCVNFEIRGRGPNFSNTSDIETSVHLSDTGITIASELYINKYGNTLTASCTSVDIDC